MKRFALVLAVATAAMLATTSSALASSANMWQDAGGGLHVQYKADTGEANNVAVSSCGVGCFDVSDPGATIAAGWGWLMSFGCKSMTPSLARCLAPVGIGAVEAALGDGNDRLNISGSVSPGATTMIGGGPGKDVLLGGPSMDNLYGNDGDDFVFAGGGACNVLGGQAGDDTLVSFTGPDILSGGTGTDTADYSNRGARVFVSLDLTVSTGSCNGSGIGNDGEAGEYDNVNEDVENVKGGNGDDSLYGNALNNRFEGGAGNDVLDGKGGADTLIGDGGIDRADYSSRSVDLTVSLDGTANDGEPNEGDNVDTDNVWGGAGNDWLFGNGDANVLYGGSGDDKLDGGLGPDVFVGDDGFDTVDYSSRSGRVDLTLDDAANDGAVNPLSPVLGEGDNVTHDIDRVLGGWGNDTLVGNNAANALYGGAGNDTIRGGGGQDTLVGDIGDDDLHVDDGDVDDSVTCGAGIDSVFFDMYLPYIYGGGSDAVAADCENATANWISPPRIKLGP